MTSAKTEPNFKEGNFLKFLTDTGEIGPFWRKNAENMQFFGIYFVCKSAVWNGAILRLGLPAIWIYYRGIT